MKKLLIVLMVCIFCFVGCSVKTSTEKETQTNENSIAEDTKAEKTSTSEVTEKNENLSKKYNIGDKVELGGVAFNIYKIDNNAGIYLLAQSSVATTSFSDEEHSGYNANVYEGSLVEDYVNEFVDDLEDKGITIKSSGIIDKDDLYELGFKHSDGLSGRPYSIDDAPKFVTYEDDFWVGGYCKYNTYSWSYTKGLLDVNPCDEEYGVRPIIIIDPSEIDKKHQSVDSNLTIKGIVDSDCAWTSGGGLENPYDRYYFDCKNMLFTNLNS